MKFAAALFLALTTAGSLIAANDPFAEGVRTTEPLTPEQQQILIQTAKETNILQIEYCHTMDKITLDKLAKQGKVVTYPDMKPFEKAMPVVYDKWFKKYPHWKAWYEEIQKINPETVSPKAGLPKM